MQYYPYDSRKELYKSIFGAVMSGEKLTLRLLLHNDARIHNAFLQIRQDDEHSFTEIEMLPADWIEDYRKYECEISLPTGLYFYKFRYTSDYGEMFVTKKERNLGCVANDGTVWQLTVYDNDYKTPDYIKGGIIYQIFPDRFYNSGKEKSGVPSDRLIKSDWYAEPQYKQNDSPDTLGNDYYCGDLKGIEEKTDYLKSLGVSLIYLNPIFEAHSNHRYNTADYMKIDPLLGNEDDLKSLCKTAGKKGIGIILDGVFSHTGSDSVYFNKEKRYGNSGAYNSLDSEYSSWYMFDNWPNEYKSWWGVKSLPETNELDPSFNEFITGENGVIRKWMRDGIAGWRLDVADELPNEIIDNIRKAVKNENKNGFLIGEVWEDASNKISHGYRRRFLQGKQLDSVMNYPFCEAILKFIGDGNGYDFFDSVYTVLENYPKETVDVLMNHIGTHDTLRSLTRIGFNNRYSDDREWQHGKKIDPEYLNTAVSLFKIAVLIQFTLPGIPSVFYGDEAGVEGFADPFCRAAYPWGRENNDLIEFYRKLGSFRRSEKCFADGDFSGITEDMGFIAYKRSSYGSSVFVAVNLRDTEYTVELSEEFENCLPVFGNAPAGRLLSVPPHSFSLISKT